MYIINETYITIFRAKDDVQDIKTAMNKAKKASGRIKKVKETIKMDEEEFKACGGISGYIERARSLLLRRKVAPAKM